RLSDHSVGERSSNQRADERTAEEGSPAVPQQHIEATAPIQQPGQRGRWCGPAMAEDVDVVRGSIRGAGQGSGLYREPEVAERSSEIERECFGSAPMVAVEQVQKPRSEI